MVEGAQAALTDGETPIEARLRAYHPVLRQPVLPDGDVSYTSTDTPVGRLVLAATERGLVACSYAGEDAVAQRLAARVSPRVLRGPRRLDPVRRQLDDYFARRRTRFETPVDLALAGTFGRAVLIALAEVSYGATTTYADIAAAIGRPRATRAVGNALGANPLCVVLPCHRVLRTGGGLGGYAGGLPAKRLLLDLERDPPTQG